MKINLTQSEIKKVRQLFQINQINIDLGELYSTFILEHSKKFHPNPKKTEVADISNDLISYFLRSLDINPRDPEFKEIRKTWQMNDIKELDRKEFLNNPYYQNIKPTNDKQKNSELFIEYYKPYQAFVYQDTTLIKDNLFSEKTHLGYFKDSFPYLALSTNKVNWMVITPHEIKTMQPAVNQAKGKLLVFGLGLGYFPYMASLKMEVESITIIENNEEIISLFQKNILPQFEQKDKIRIICSDAFDYLEKSNETFDYIFVDLYRAPEDGFPIYKQIKQFEKKYPSATFYYWIETSILCYLRRIILLIIEEVLEGSTDKNYIQADNDYDRLFNEIYFKLKKETFDSYDDLICFLDLKHLSKWIID